MCSWAIADALSISQFCHHHDTTLPDHTLTLSIFTTCTGLPARRPGGGEHGRVPCGRRRRAGPVRAVLAAPAPHRHAARPGRACALHRRRGLSGAVRARRRAAQAGVTAPRRGGPARAAARPAPCPPGSQLARRSSAPVHNPHKPKQHGGQQGPRRPERVGAGTGRRAGAAASVPLCCRPLQTGLAAGLGALLPTPQLAVGVQAATCVGRGLRHGHVLPCSAGGAARVNCVCRTLWVRHLGVRGHCGSLVGAQSSTCCSEWPRLCTGCFAGPLGSRLLFGRLPSNAGVMQE